MTEKETKSFQIKTLLLAAAITILSNLVFSAFGYYREDSQDFDEVVLAVADSFRGYGRAFLVDNFFVKSKKFNTRHICKTWI